MDPVPTEPPVPTDPQRSSDDGPGRRFMRALRENNPFYLLSAASMLGGCLLLTNSLSWTSIRFTQLIAMLVTINLYEVMLLALGLYLIAQRGHRRDGLQLLWLAAAFMGDAAFLVSEVVASHLTAGAAISLGLLVAALIKVRITLSVLHIEFDIRRWGMCAVMLAAMFGLPVWLKAVGDTHVKGGHFYAGWWMLAALWAAWDVLSGWHVPTARKFSPRLPVEGLFVVVPWLSAATHLGILHYVYNQPYVAADAAPLLLALSLMLARLPKPAVADIAVLRTALIRALPLVAVIISMRPQTHLALALGHWVTLSPLIICLAGSYLVTAWINFPRYFARAVMGGVAGMAVYTVGPTPSQAYAWVVAACSGVYSVAVSAIECIFGVASRGGSWVWAGVCDIARWTRDILPNTAVGWGVVSMGSAFALLAVGARLSLKRSPPATRPASGSDVT